MEMKNVQMLTDATGMEIKYLNKNRVVFTTHTFLSPIPISLNIIQIITHL